MIDGPDGIPASFSPADVCGVVRDVSSPPYPGETVGIACQDVMVFICVMACARLDKSGAINFFV